ncbi:hypothetical protein SY89_01666 [Halolamina pelagica]|uniref:Uncharacterized protein n=1 Tax=Halolamina pelagica TaxID=699431 RepID=A0A0P7HVJ4_9EURY|nr:hypothetical protein SY89_01666 [Halolamina pelagica]
MFVDDPVPDVTRTADLGAYAPRRASAVVFARGKRRKR